jgi:hypothetical protein
MHLALYCAKLGVAAANKQSKALPNNKDICLIALSARRPFVTAFCHIATPVARYA